MQKFKEIRIPEKVMRSIEDSEFFLMVVGKYFFSDPATVGQLLYAKALKKPVGVALLEGVALPREYMDGAEVFSVQSWTEEGDSIKICAEKIIADFETWRKKHDKN